MNDYKTNLILFFTDAALRGAVVKDVQEWDYPYGVSLRKVVVELHVPDEATQHSLMDSYWRLVRAPQHSIQATVFRDAAGGAPTYSLMVYVPTREDLPDPVCKMIED